MGKETVLGIHPDAYLVHTCTLGDDGCVEGSDSFFETDYIIFYRFLDMQDIFLVGHSEDHLHAYILGAQAGKVDYHLAIQRIVLMEGQASRTFFFQAAISRALAQPSARRKLKRSYWG